MSGSEYLVNASFWFMVALGIYCAVAIFRDAIDRPSPGDKDHYTSSDQRCINTRLKQEAARQWMKKHGFKTLLEGHKGWQVVNPMAEQQPPAQVVQLRRKPR